MAAKTRGGGGGSMAARMTAAGAAAALVVAVGAALLASLAPAAAAGGRGTAESRPRQGGRRQVAAALSSGDAAPEAMLETLDGDHIQVSQLQGKVVVLDFWATWCGPCIAALPSLKRLAQAHGDLPKPRGRRDRPFALISISGDSNGARLREFVANHELSWTQCWDGNADAQRAFGVRSLPTYFVIDAAGRIVYVKAGWGRSTEQEIERQVEKALAQGSAGADTRQPAAASR